MRVDQASAAPTRKWIIATVTAVSGLAVSAISTGWQTEESISLVGIVTGAFLSYMARNDPPAAS